LRRLLALVVLAVVALPLAAAAHPLGNFTINHHVALAVDGTDLDVQYVVDFAEIPAFNEITRIDADRDGHASPEELSGYAREQCVALGEGLVVAFDGDRLDLDGTDSSALTQPGQNDVPTVRLECNYVAAIGEGLVTIENTNYPERIGWAEIIASSETVPITTDLPSESASDYLTAYPQGALAETPDVRSAEIKVGQGRLVAGAAAPLLALGSAFDVEKAGIGAALLALGAALLLGTAHALAPGHGKTIVAAYLVGTRGTPRQAFVLAGATAVSHTAGVAILGLIAAGASTAFEPTMFYPYLSTLAGLVILGVGGRLLWLAIKRRGHGHSHDHSHDHDHGHDHGDGSHTHEHGEHGAEPEESKPTLGWKAVAALGFSGGLVPSASAVVLLLGAIQLGRAWFGVLLVAAFGVGMASALVASGLLAVVAHRFGWKWFARNRPESNLWRWVPVTAASAVVVLGLVLTLSAVGDLPIL